MPACGSVGVCLGAGACLSVYVSVGVCACVYLFVCLLIRHARVGTGRFVGEAELLSRSSSLRSPLLTSFSRTRPVLWPFLLGFFCPLPAGSTPLHTSCTCFTAGLCPVPGWESSSFFLLAGVLGRNASLSGFFFPCALSSLTSLLTPR